MNFKKIFLIIMLIMVFSLTISVATAKTENVKPTTKNSKVYDGSYTSTIKTTTKNFVMTHTRKFTKKNYNPHEGPWAGYLTVESKNKKIKIKSIKVNQGNGLKGFKWKTYKINSNKKTINLGKNILVKTYEEGKGWQQSYIVTY